MWDTVIRAIGVAHLGIAAGNFLLPWLFDYRTHLPAMPLPIRQIYVAHSLFLIVVVAMIGVLCLAFPIDLAGASRLGRALSGGLALFWAARLLLQACWFERAMLRRLRWLSLPFTALIAAFAAVFAACAAGAGLPLAAP